MIRLFLDFTASSVIHHPSSHIDPPLLFVHQKENVEPVRDSMLSYAFSLAKEKAYGNTNRHPGERKTCS